MPARIAAAAQPRRPRLARRFERRSESALRAVTSFEPSRESILRLDPDHPGGGLALLDATTGELRCGEVASDGFDSFRSMVTGWSKRVQGGGNGHA